MVDYDDRTALIVVDVQNDFADPSGSLYVPEGEKTLPFINEQIGAAREAGALVVYTQDSHPPQTPHFKDFGGIWPKHCVMDSWGWQFHPQLLVDGEVIRKGTGGEDGYSGFTVRDPESGEEDATRLGALLRRRGIQKVVVVGLATDYCVKETALDALQKGYQLTLLQQGIRGVDLQKGDSEKAIRAVRARGGVVE